MESGEGVGVYAEAKSEYTKQLCQFIVPSIQQYFLDLLEEAKLKEADSKRVLVMFQTLLEDISDWNVDKVQRETDSIVKSSQCDYLEELMTAVFIAHTKVLSAIRLTTKQKKLQITIPKLDHFIHRILRESSRLLWSNTYLFSTSAPSIERQKNLRLIENFLQEGVLQGIRGMLPVKNILREYLKEDDEEEKADEHEEKSEKSEEKSEESDKKSEEKSEEKSDKKSEEKSEEEKPEVDTSNTPNVTTPISFTGSDTLEKETFDDVEPGIGSEEIKILDEPPEPMDEPDELEKEELQMDFDELT